MTTQPRILVTGASGQLGRLVVAALSIRVGAQSVAALVRDPSRAAPLLPQGVAILEGDYDQPGSLDAAFVGAERLLLISSNALGERVAQHRNAIGAAKQAGVKRIAYTSVLHADTSKAGLAEEHRQTEKLIRASGIPFALLRNGWYTENYVAGLSASLQHGAIIGSAREGRISSASRSDYADAAVAVLLADDQPVSAVYELAGDVGYTRGEFAAEVSRQARREIPYVDLPEAKYREALEAAGLPSQVAALVADSDAAAADGALFDESKQLSRLIGRPTTPFAATISEGLESLNRTPA
jgi:NAD(P)H dehydrogenase (quinone)